MTKSCLVCSETFEGRRDRQWCTPNCKKTLKSLYDRELHLVNRDKNIKRACDWQRSNRERKREYDRARRETLPKKPYRKLPTDPEQSRLRAAKRRAAKRSQGVYVVTKSDLSRALVRSSNRCAYCRGEFTQDNPLEWDHIVPVARGGSHSIGNIAPSCRSCNRNKQVKFIVEWRANKVICARTISKSL